MDIEQMRIRMGEMAAEVERMQSIVDEQQSPAVAVPDNAELHCMEAGHRDYFARTGNLCSCKKYLFVPHPSPQRVTEQDAYDIILNFYWFMDAFKNKHGRNPSVIEWREAEGRALLAKLNDKSELELLC